MTANVLGHPGQSLPLTSRPLFSSLYTIDGDFSSLEGQLTIIPSCIFSTLRPEGPDGDPTGNIAGSPFFPQADIVRRTRTIKPPMNKELFLGVRGFIVSDLR
jgi:hypothetical protein